MPSPVFLAVYIATTNDTNGNPRRGWYVSRLDGAPIIPAHPTGRKGETAPVYTCWVEEGYRGSFALVSTIAGHFEVYARTGAEIDAARALVRETGRISVTPGEYRDARKLPALPRLPAGGGAE